MAASEKADALAALRRLVDFPSTATPEEVRATASLAIRVIAGPKRKGAEEAPERQVPGQATIHDAGAG